MPQKIIVFILLQLGCLLSFSQTVEKASLMKIKDPYGQADQPHLYKSLKNGSKILTGEIGYSMHYNNWVIPNLDSVPSYNLRYFVALFSSTDSLLWVKYTDGLIQAVETDSKNNIYLTGTYRSELHTSDGDTLALLSNYTNYFGNIFIIKLDSAGKRKWWKTTDNEENLQSDPYGDYIKIDPDFNVYLSGHYEKFIRFNAQISFRKVSPFLGSIPFLAKLDSNGNYKWVRDWKFDTGLPCGLSLDSCKIYTYAVLGSSQTHLRIRKYDFSGKLMNTDSISCNTDGLFWANNINVKNDRLLMISLEGNQKKIGYYNLSGNLLWSKNYSSSISIQNLTFTQNNKIFFSGEAIGDTGTIGNTTISGSIYWGYMDTTGTILSIKSISKVRKASLPSLPYLSDDGRLYFNAVVDYYSNNSGNTYTIDTITFNNLTYYDTGSGIISGIYYRLLAQYFMSDGSYFNPGNCSFSPILDNCLDREGLYNCSPGAFTLTVTPECSGISSRIKLNWTFPDYANNFDIYKGGSLYYSGYSGTQFIDTIVTVGNSYTYRVKAKNSGGITYNSNGILSATAPNCSDTSVIESTDNPHEIKVFPNPSNGAFHLTAKRLSNKTVSIDVINTLGQVIYSTEQRVSSNDYSKTIDIVTAANGIYLLKITIDNKKYLVTVAKQ